MIDYKISQINRMDGQPAKVSVRFYRGLEETVQVIDPVDSLLKEVVWYRRTALIRSAEYSYPEATADAAIMKDLNRSLADEGAKIGETPNRWQAVVD